MGRRQQRRSSTSLVWPATSLPKNARASFRPAGTGRPLVMAFDDPSMDAYLRETLDAHEIALGEEWDDGRPRPWLGLCH